MAQVSLPLLQSGKHVEAERYLRESLGIRDTKQPEAWTTFDTKAMLGRALSGQGKFDEAGPLLVRGYGGMKAREGSIPAAGRIRIDESLDVLVEHFEAAGKSEEAARWKKEREARKGGEKTN